MPRPIKRRIVKKVRTEEEVVNMYERVKDFYEENHKQIQIYVIAFIVLIVVSVGFYLYYRNTSDKALKLQVSAYNSYRAALNQNDRKLYDSSLEQFKRSYEIKESPVVLYYQGDIYQAIGEVDKGIDALSVLVDRFSSDEFLLPLAYRKLGMLYVQKGNYEKALKVFGEMEGRQMATFKDFAIYQIGKIYKKTGNEEQAEKYSRKLAELFPASPYAREVEALLQPEKEEIKKEPDQSKPVNKEANDK